MRMTSKTLALPFALSKKHIVYRICYCAIIPGQCWLSDSSKDADPRPLSSCPVIENDLMHTSPVDELDAQNV